MDSGEWATACRVALVSFTDIYLRKCLLRLERIKDILYEHTIFSDKSQYILVVSVSL